MVLVGNMWEAHVTSLTNLITYRSPCIDFAKTSQVSIRALSDKVSQWSDLGSINYFDVGCFFSSKNSNAFVLFRHQQQHSFFCFVQASTTWLLFYYNVNNMAVKTDNGYIVGMEELRDFWRGFVNLDKARQWSDGSDDDLPTMTIIFNRYSVLAFVACHR